MSNLCHDVLDEDRCDIIGVSVSSGPPSEVTAALATRISQGRPMRIGFLNAHLSNLCGRSPELRSALAGFILLNDGVGLDIAARILRGRPFPANLNGTDLTTALLAEQGHRWRIFCLGARPEVVARASATIKDRWPQHEVVGHHDGYYSDDAALAREVRASRPDLVIVGLGNPRQERWIATNIPDLSPAGIAVGAWFDFLTGAVPRAPSWMRRARLEWVFRLAIEPRRLAKRYLLGNPLFLCRVAGARLFPNHPRATPSGGASR